MDEGTENTIHDAAMDKLYEISEGVDSVISDSLNKLQESLTERFVAELNDAVRRVIADAVEGFVGNIIDEAYSTLLSEATGKIESASGPMAAAIVEALAQGAPKITDFNPR